jgi:signal transduction histidine kinase
MAALTAVIAMAFFPTALFRDPNFEMNRFIIRVAYLAVVGTLLAYLATHEQRLRVDLSRLAVWPHITPRDNQVLARDMLEHAAGILGTSHALLAWEEREEPWLHLASWSDGTFEYNREPPALYGSLVAEPLSGKSFFCPDARIPLATLTQDHRGFMQRWKGAPLHADLQKRFDIGAVLALRLSGASAEGYLFGLDKQRMTTDDLALGGVLVREVAIRLDQFYLLEQLQRGAAAEERVRLARDLHDGLLQSLTGVALQLETVQRLMQSEPGLARQRLEEIQELIAREQKELRSHIQTLKPGSSGLADTQATLRGRLSELAERIARQWGLHVEVNLKHPEIEVQGSLAQEIYFLVHESMINAARHAGASSVHAELSVECDRMRIIVVDDGRGFPFRGYHDHAVLTELNIGPVTLRERVASIGGSLAIDSAETGTRIEIAVPIAEKGR